AEHRSRVPTMRCVLYRASLHAVSWRVRALQFGMLFLDTPQFYHQAVIFRIGQRRVVIDKILIVSFLDLVAQRSNMCCKLFCLAFTGLILIWRFGVALN